MTVKEVVERLLTVNQNADFQVIAHNNVQAFTWTYGSSEGCTPENCDHFGPYLDELNTSERIVK